MIAYSLIIKCQGCGKVSTITNYRTPYTGRERPLTESIMRQAIRKAEITAECPQCLVQGKFPVIGAQSKESEG